MARRPRAIGVWPTLWEVPDDLGPTIQPMLAAVDPPKRTGRRRSAARGALHAISFRMRSRCPWTHLPKTFPTDRSVHRPFPRWVRLGVFTQLWATLVVACAERGGVDGEWQAVATALGKARLGGI